MKSATSESEKLVIIGNGLAAMQLLKELDFQSQYQVCVLSAESVPHYNRIMLSSLLADEVNLTSITPCNDQWYQERNIQVHLNHKVQTINYQQQTLSCENGAEFHYDKLVFATGSQTYIPNIPGTFIDEIPDGVIGFRELFDVEYMRKIAAQHQNAVVVGAGLLGIEAAVGLINQGMKVTLLHRRDTVMNRQIDHTASELLKKELLQRGIQIITGNEPVKIHKNTINQQIAQVCAVELDNGDKHPADLVVFATGIVPCVQLAQDSGLLVKKGIVVDQHMQTNQANVYALGECCEFNGTTYGLVAPIWNQAKVLAANLKGENARYQEAEFATKLKVSGVDVHSMGYINPEQIISGCEVIELQDFDAAVYKKILISNHKVVGAVLYGDVADSQWYFELLQDQQDISALRDGLIFGRAFCSPLC